MDQEDRKRIEEALSILHRRMQRDHPAIVVSHTVGIEIPDVYDLDGFVMINDVTYDDALAAIAMITIDYARSLRKSTGFPITDILKDISEELEKRFDYESRLN